MVINCFSCQTFNIQQSLYNVMINVKQLSTYLWISYLAIMMCCVQSAYLHHGMHSNHHNSQHAQLSSSVDSNSYTASSEAPQSETTIFKSLFSLAILLGVILILSLILPKFILQLKFNTIFFIRRIQRRRRYYQLLFTSSLGLRAPPSQYKFG